MKKTSQKSPSLAQSTERSTPRSLVAEVCFTGDFIKSMLETVQALKQSKPSLQKSNWAFPYPYSIRYGQ